MSIDREVALIAGLQLGLITFEQALTCGMTPRAVQYRVDSGRWERRFPGVYRVVGAPRSWEQDLLAAVLAAGPGAAASHRSAAALWRLDGVDGGSLEITVDRCRFPRLEAVVVHRSSDIAEAHITTRSGIPATSPVRTLVDLGAVSPIWVVERALDHAVASRLVTLAGVRLEVDRVARRGRRGAGILRQLLDERAADDGRVESVLEAAVMRLCRREGLPLPLCQVDVRDGGRFVARVDFAYPDVRLAIEVDGYGSHAGYDAFQHDRARQNALVQAGWTVLRFTWDDVVHRPGHVAATIHRILGTLNAAERR